jgi:hypothetical protein
LEIPGSSCSIRIVALTNRGAQRRADSCARIVTYRTADPCTDR